LASLGLSEVTMKRGLAFQCRAPMFDILLEPVVPEAGGKAIDKANRRIGGAQQQRTGIRVIVPPSKEATT
jgi:hypothetical protein